MLQGIQAIGIEHHRNRHVSEHRFDHNRDSGGLSQAGTEGDDVLALSKSQHRRDRRHCHPAFDLLGQRGRQVAGIGSRCDRLHLLRHREIDQTGAAAQGGATAEDGCAGHAATAGDHEDATEGALVGVREGAD